MSRFKYLSIFFGMLFSILNCMSSTPFVLKEQPPKFSSEPTERGNAQIGDLSIYYEVHGKNEGIPLVLLNGGGSTIETTYSKLLPIFSKHRRVIALDEQAHGRTGDRKGPLRFHTSADDVAGLLKHLKIEKVDVLGFSNGASVALHLAVRHPKLVNKLVFASSMSKKSGAFPQFWEYMKKTSFEEMPQTLKDVFLQVNPDPQKLRNMYEKDVERMQNFKDLSDKEVASIKIPTLIVQGDRDVPKLEHAVELVRLIPNARLLVLPAGHGDYLGEAIGGKQDRYPELTASLIEDFLDGYK
ncbi:alpha/beta fold hydrolase [Leptospira sarikeiensis]|uniref:Alpha/beta hydrolase n=1 Tax=Leptospira sarikeiensis TaxID=2484943 RepID=A0A4R9JYT0_9LEPT|nr:alpha/beta hydrolase [Leptospira sarikeiensis]TGL57692.1 alpha/beta hydrolase [Leptospira sarikeiensis]